MSTVEAWTPESARTSMPDGIIQSAQFKNYTWRIEDDLDVALRSSRA